MRLVGCARLRRIGGLPVKHSPGMCWSLVLSPAGSNQGLRRAMTRTRTSHPRASLWARTKMRTYGCAAWNVNNVVARAANLRDTRKRSALKHTSSAKRRWMIPRFHAGSVSSSRTRTEVSRCLLLTAVVLECFDGNAQ